MKFLPQDLRWAVRMLLKAPSFTVVAVLSLAIGIGVVTTVFSIANTILLRPLPVKDPDSLVDVHKPDPNGSRIHVISYPDYLDYRERNEVFSDFSVWSEIPLSLSTRDQSKPATGMLVSDNYFALLGLQPALGRFFLPEEDQISGSSP